MSTASAPAAFGRTLTLAYSALMTQFRISGHAPPKMAIDCQWLRRTIDSSIPQDPFRTLCTHIVRDGQDCIGPFLEDMETGCRLWEPNERAVSRIQLLGL
jgi:hypothetical protein